jgi:adenylate cyclase
MAVLEATGQNGKNWRRPLPLHQELSLGRNPTKSKWDVPWDLQISGLHATLLWNGVKLRVRKLPEGKNQIIFRGRPQEDFEAGVGERFAIGETIFIVEESLPVPPDRPISELTCSPSELREIKFADPGARIEALAELPKMIRLAPSDQDLEAKVLDILFRGIPDALGAAIVRIDTTDPGDAPEITVGTQLCRKEPDETFTPSRRLIVDAIRLRRQPVLHNWFSGDTQYTTQPGCDWAMCAPLPDEPHPGWALYITGRMPEDVPLAEGATRQDLLKGDLKFAGLVADMFGSLRHVRDLQHRQTLLNRFLSRPVLQAIANRDINEVLQPRQARVTVLFCDIRGSCRIAEQCEDDLDHLCEMVSEALSIVTNHVIYEEGVIGDFQGDAAMGFWGWPLDVPSQIERAARAALAIYKRFKQVSQQGDHLLSGFDCGIGIATGPAIAGRLGTYDQFKVSVLGPVVNRAARLESLAKQFANVHILADEETAADLNRGQSTSWIRCRRLMQLKLYNLSKPIMVHELLPPAVEPRTLSDGECRDYDVALKGFLEGRWHDAYRKLQSLPRDGAAQFLMQFMEEHRHNPPTGWDGTIEMKEK